jgi:hypothetical protein
MWQGILTRTHGTKGGLVVIMDEVIGAPNPDRRAAKREAMESLIRRAEKGKLGDGMLEVSIRHSACDPGNGNDGIELRFS